MSEGKDRYDERKRLQAENELLRMQNENARLKETQGSFELQNVLTSAVMAFFKGEAHFNLMPGNAPGSYMVTFWQPPKDLSLPEQST